ISPIAYRNGIFFDFALAPNFYPIEKPVRSLELVADFGRKRLRIHQRACAAQKFFVYLRSNRQKGGPYLPILIRDCRIRDGLIRMTGSPAKRRILQAIIFNEHIHPSLLIDLLILKSPRLRDCRWSLAQGSFVHRSILLG